MIDWSLAAHLPLDTCTCACGVTYPSHAAVVEVQPGTWETRSRWACPGCGRYEALVLVKATETVYVRQG